MQILLDHQADANGPASSATPLGLTCMGEHLEIIQMLLKRGANVNARAHGETALEVSMRREKADIVQLLVDNGADVNSRKDTLVAASRVGRLDLVRILLGSLTGINAELEHALFDSSAGGHTSVVQLLLERGADPNSQGIISYQA